MEEQDLSRRQEKTIYTDGDTISTLLVLIFHHFFGGKFWKETRILVVISFFFPVKFFCRNVLFFCNTRTWVRAKTYIYIWGGLTSCLRDFVNTPAIRMIQLKADLLLQMRSSAPPHTHTLSSLIKDYLSNLSFSHSLVIITFLMKVCLADFWFC